MHILIDARMAGIVGGHGRYITELIKKMNVSHPNAGGNHFTILVKKEDKEKFGNLGFHYHLLTADFHWYGFKEQKELSKILYFLKPDLAHFPHWNVPMFWNGKFVVTIHDLIPIHHPTARATTKNFLTYWFKYLTMLVLIKRAITKSVAIIVPTNAVKNDISKKYGSIPKLSDKIHVINHGIEMTSIQKTSVNDLYNNENTIEYYNIQKPYFLYVGVAYPHKNLEFLIKTFLNWKKTTQSSTNLVLVGAKNYFYNKLENAFGKTDSIKFLHDIGDNELKQIYKNAEVFVFPSIEEGFGLPPIEAMAAGLPVISSNIKCMQEVLGTLPIYFDPNKSETLISALNKFEQFSTEEKNKIIELGKKHSQQFSWNKTAEQTFALYTKFKQ